VFDIWLRRKMAERRLGNDALAKELRIHPTTVGRWLEEGAYPNRKQVVKLAAFFKVSPVTILQLTDPDEYTSFVNDPVRQQDEIDALSGIPEMRGVAARLRRMTPQKRAAWLALINGDEGGGSESDVAPTAQ
jgi:transcriptional regulator with XRE-family HTH domain